MCVYACVLCICVCVHMSIYMCVCVFVIHIYVCVCVNLCECVLVLAHNMRICVRARIDQDKGRDVVIMETCMFDI